MNSTINNTTLTASEIIQVTYQNYVNILISVGTLTLLLYTTVLVIAQETEYMWSKRFSFPTILYIFTRYGNLVLQGLNFWLLFVPPGSLCNVVVDIANTLSVVVYIGIQGLLVIRAYSLCQGNKAVAGLLIIILLGGFVSNLFGTIAFNGCIENPSLSGEIFLNALIANICTVCTDFVVFCVCLFKVWGTWRLKRETGIHSTNDLVSILLRQIVSRFCFVSITTITFTILDQFVDEIPIVNDLATFQQTFSGLLLADFTLNLRRQNSAEIEATNLTLPNIQIRSVFQYIHRSIIAEMGDHDIPSDSADDEFVLDAETGLTRD